MEESLNSDDICDIGEKHHQAGRLQEAESCYRKALEADPGHPGALYFLAGIAYDDGRLQFATQLIEELLRGEPNDAEAWHLLGMVALKEESFPRASECFKKALAIQPAYAQAHYSLGSALSGQSYLDAALESFQRAVALNPAFAEAYCSIGNIFQTLSDFEAAVSSYQQAINVKPGFALAYENIGGILLAQGKLDEAITIYRKAVAENAGSALVHAGLGTAHLFKNQNADAAVSFERAIALDPSCFMAYSNLGDVLIKQGKVSEAVASFQRAVTLNPQDPRLLTNLSKGYREAGELTEAISCAQQAIALDPNFVEAYTALLFLSNYLPDYPRERIFADHVAFGERFEAPLRKNWLEYSNAINPQKRLRVGFVSGDLRGHPVGYFFEGILRELRKLDGIDIIIYSTNATTDEVTDRLRAVAPVWSLVSSLSDDAFEQRIRGDNIDILIDLSGHTIANRLLVFARKPAPIQVTWLGYWETTGLRAIDYILCDRYGVRDDEAKFYVERPWYLPHTRLCFTLPTEQISVAPLPAPSNGHITFGCFNNLVKMTDRVVAVWARILRRVPNARLLLKSKSFTDSTVRENILTRFAAQGVVADRLLLEPASPRHQYFAAYNRVDIALDPFPFPGGTTSVDGIWMGVPMITMRGDRIIARQGESILYNLGLQDWIAANEDDYVELAVRRAEDLASLATLRGQLREKLETSSLCDAKLFAQNLEEAFKQMWGKYCEASASVPTSVIAMDVPPKPYQGKSYDVAPASVPTTDVSQQNSVQINPDEFVNLVVGAALGDGLPSGQPVNFSARRSKPTIVIAAAPKSGSTFLSNVVSRVTKLPYMRLSSAYSTNEHDLYLPALYIMNNGGCVSQLHMKGTFHNAALLRIFGIKPIILVRNIEDTVVSLADELRAKEQRDNFGSGQYGFSFLWQDHAIAKLNETSLMDCIIDLAIPWYVNFYASWYRLCARKDVDAMWVTYEEMMQDKRTMVSNILEFAGFGKGIHIDDAILEQRYAKFNIGQNGRGSTILSEEQKTRIKRLFSYYPDIDFSKYGLPS